MISVIMARVFMANILQHMKLSPQIVNTTFSRKNNISEVRVLKRLILEGSKIISLDCQMSVTFPTDFSLVATSQMCNFLSGNFQVCPSRSARSSVCSGCDARPPSTSKQQRSALRHHKVPNLTFGNLPLGKLNIWKYDT